MTLNPKQVHDFEQLAGIMKEIALTVVGYFNVLVENGMSREEALEFALNFQHSVISSGMRPREDYE